MLIYVDIVLAEFTVTFVDASQKCYNSPFNILKNVNVNFFKQMIILFEVLFCANVQSARFFKLRALWFPARLENSRWLSSHAYTNTIRHCFGVTYANCKCRYAMHKICINENAVCTRHSSTLRVTTKLSKCVINF